MKNKILKDIYNNKISRIPIEYIVKQKIFYKNKIKIKFPVLISRNESEIITKTINKIYNKIFTKKIYDLGFGSGTIYETIKKKIYIEYSSIDNLYINSIKNKKNIFLFHSDWFYFFLSFKKQNMLVANPPYISISEIKHYNFNFESKNSLLSYQNGFHNLFDIIKNSYEILTKNGLILLEHGYSQSKKIRKILKICGYNNIFTFNDKKYLQRLTYAEK